MRAAVPEQIKSKNAAGSRAGGKPKNVPDALVRDVRHATPPKATKTGKASAPAIEVEAEARPISRNDAEEGMPGQVRLVDRKGIVSVPASKPLRMADLLAPAPHKQAAAPIEVDQEAVPVTQSWTGADALKSPAAVAPNFGKVWPIYARSVVNDYLKEQGPGGKNAIEVKQVFTDKDGKLTALEIYRKGSDSKTKILDLNETSWKGSRLQKHLKSEGVDFSTFFRKMQTQVDRRFGKTRADALSLPSFSPDKEGQLALTTLGKVIPALDRLDKNLIDASFMRSKVQSTPNVVLHDAASRDLYENSDLGKLDTLNGDELKKFIEDMVSLSVESMYKNRRGKFSFDEAKGFITSFKDTDHQLGDIPDGIRDRKFRDVAPDTALIQKVFSDAEARAFAVAMNNLGKKIGSLSPHPEHKKMHLNFHALPFVFVGHTAATFALEVMGNWQPENAISENQATYPQVVYANCALNVVERVFEDPAQYFPAEQ